MITISCTLLLHDSKQKMKLHLLLLRSLVGRAELMLFLWVCCCFARIAHFARISPEFQKNRLKRGDNRNLSPPTAAPAPASGRSRWERERERYIYIYIYIYICLLQHQDVVAVLLGQRRLLVLRLLVHLQLNHGSVFVVSLFHGLYVLLVAYVLYIWLLLCLSRQPAGRTASSAAWPPSRSTPSAPGPVGTGLMGT